MVKKIKLQTFRFLYLLLGFFVMALGVNFIVNANLGVNSWNVLHIGITLHTNLTLGQATQVMTFILIIINLFLRIKPWIATICGMIFVGLFVDLIAQFNIIKPVDSPLLSFLFLIIGTFLMGSGSGIYLNSNLGAGPRDGLMMGLTRLTGKSVAFIKTVIEFSALLIGYLLGGPVGIGTIIYSLMVGRVVQWSLTKLKLPLYINEKGQLIKHTG